MNKEQGDKYFYATSFYVAAFLFAKGLELVNIDRKKWSINFQVVPSCRVCRQKSREYWFFEKLSQKRQQGRGLLKISKIFFLNQKQRFLLGRLTE